MTYKEIIDFITSNNLDRYKTFIAISCWQSYRDYKSYHSKSSLDFNVFCTACENIWIHDYSDHSLCLLADEIIWYYTMHKRLPNKISQLNL